MAMIDEQIVDFYAFENTRELYVKRRKMNR